MTPPPHRTTAPIPTSPAAVPIASSVEGSPRDGVLGRPAAQFRIGVDELAARSTPREQSASLEAGRVTPSRIGPWASAELCPSPF
jgi:hypothetical protein